MYAAKRTSLKYLGSTPYALNPYCSCPATKMRAKSCSWNLRSCSSTSTAYSIVRPCWVENYMYCIVSNGVTVWVAWFFHRQESSRDGKTAAYNWVMHGGHNPSVNSLLGISTLLSSTKLATSPLLLRPKVKIFTIPGSNGYLRRLWKTKRPEDGLVKMKPY